MLRVMDLLSLASQISEAFRGKVYKSSPLKLRGMNQCIQ
jgi:hypothetical protein